MGRKKNAYVEQKRKNDTTWQYYMNRYAELAQSMFKWPDMGPYFDSRFIESCLFARGWATIWYDEVMGSFLCGNVIPGANLDIYGNYTTWNVQCINGYNRALDTSNAVIVYNSEYRSTSAVSAIAKPIPPFIMLTEIVDNMTLLHQSMKQNLEKLSLPLFISGTQQQRLTIENIVKYSAAKVPYIFVDKDAAQSLDGDIKALSTQVQCYVDMFSTELSKEWCEGLTFLGLDNMGQSKKERLLVDEVNANNQQVSMAAISKLNARNRAIERLNLIYDVSLEKVELQEAGMDATMPYNYSDKGTSYSSEPENNEELKSNGGDTDG